MNSKPTFLIKCFTCFQARLLWHGFRTPFYHYGQCLTEVRVCLRHSPSLPLFSPSRQSFGTPWFTLQRIPSSGQLLFQWCRTCSVEVNRDNLDMRSLTLGAEGLYTYPAIRKGVVRSSYDVIMWPCGTDIQIMLRAVTKSEQLSSELIYLRFRLKRKRVFRHCQ